MNVDPKDILSEMLYSALMFDAELDDSDVQDKTTYRKGFLDCLSAVLKIVREAKVILEKMSPEVIESYVHALQAGAFLEIEGDQLKLSANMNDTFAWGTAYFESIEPIEIGIYNHMVKRFPDRGDVAWVAHKINAEPMKEIAEELPFIEAYTYIKSFGEYNPEHLKTLCTYGEES